jgi:hypothetical protein
MATNAASTGVGAGIMLATGAQQARCARNRRAFNSAPPAFELISINCGPSGPRWKS